MILGGEFKFAIVYLIVLIVVSLLGYFVIARLLT